MRFFPMILAGARGKLLSVDTKNKTLSILRCSIETNYEYEDSLDAKKLLHLVGKNVDLELCDFYVIGASANEE